MKILILSDTHNLIREQVRDYLPHVDCIIHAGDFNSQAILDEFKSYAKVYAVAGNNDQHLEEQLPEALFFTLENKTFYMTHIKQALPKDFHIDYYIYGHSHKFEHVEIDGTVYLNPGSPGPRRFRLELSFVIMTIEDSISIEKIVITL